MTIYSDFSAQRTRQIVFDAWAIITIAIGVWLGTVVSATIVQLADVGHQLEVAGAGFKNSMKDAGDVLGQVPFVGEAIRQPFDNAKGTGGALEQAGQVTQDVIVNTATVSGIAVTGVIVIAVCLVWLPFRIRFLCRKRETMRISNLDDGMDVLALRAFVNGSSKALAGAGPLAFEAWRNGDREAIARLASLELREAGVSLAG